MSITHKYVTSADGTRLFAQAAGNPTNPAVICAHGFGGTSFAFHKQLVNPRLLEHVYIIVYDLRGNGRSDMPEEPAAYAGKKMAEDFQAVSTAFGVKRPILLGWSLAAMLLLDILNALPPSFLRGTIWSGGPVPTRQVHASFISPWLASTLGPLLGNDAATVGSTAIVFVDSCVARPLSYEERVHWLGELALAPHATRVACELESRARDDTAFFERAAGVPLLVIMGKEDKHVDVHKCKEVLDAGLGGKGRDYEWAWVEEAGHAVFWDQPAVHDELVVKFVRRLTS